MGFLGGLFSGSQGAGFQAQQAATPEQAQQLYQQQQQQLAQQQAFTQALMAQSPQAIAAQQQALSQMQAQAQGLGPSVAQRQLAETTGQNVAQTAALMASKRGASANAGLVGRQAAMAGAGIQQQAAGQAATLRAQEQMAAQQGMAGLAGQQLGQIQGAQQLGLQGTAGAQANVYNAVARQNEINAQIAAGNQRFQGQLLGGLMGGLAQAPFLGGSTAGAQGASTAAPAAAAALAGGGEVQSQDDQSHHYWHDIAKEFSKSFQPLQGEETGGYKAGQAIGSGIGKGIGALFAAKGGKVPAMVSPGEQYLPPSEVKKVADGKKSPLHAGRKIPGQAKVPGDSLKNDTVPTTLEEGGVVIPRSVMMSDNPAEKARKFVEAIVAKQSLKGHRK